MTCTGNYYPNGILNPELERRKEFERRKKLRLLQVRQQSKEFTDRLRERIKGEITQEKKKYVESENKLKQEKHLQELCQLKELYDKCLQSIGEGHKQAAKQPDLNLEKQAELARITDRANKRGGKALKKQIEDEASLKQKIEAPVKQKKATRNKENLRAFFISSLPKHVEYSGPRSVSPPKSCKNTGAQKTRRVLEEIPSNLTGCESRVPDLQNHKSPEKQNHHRKEGENHEHSRRDGLTKEVVPVNKSENLPSNVSSPRECSCDYIVCSCHKSPNELRRCSSESRISIEKELCLEEPRKKKVRSRSCSPQSVRTLNYFDCGNVYESKQQSCVRVTHHSRSPKRTEEEPVPNTVQDISVSKLSLEELKKRTDERSAKALRKEQLKRDFQNLIQNLKKLTQVKSVISSKTKGKLKVYASERDILTRNETKQRNLNNAFEKLPHSVKSTKTQNTGLQKPNQSPTDDSSPPTLNLALCQTKMSSPMIRGVVSTEEISITGTPTSSSRSKRPQSKPQTAQSSRRARSESPSVLVNRDPSGDVHITVKVSEVIGGSSKSPATPSSDSSYLSPPKNLTPSQQQLLNALLSQVNKRAIGDEMKKYISKLLNMSRESIEELRGQRSKSPESAISSQSASPDPDIEQDLVRLGELAEVYAEKVNTLVDMYEQMRSPSSPDFIDPIRCPPGGTPPSQAPAPSPRSTPSHRPRSPETPPAPGPSHVICPTPGPSMTPKPRSPSPPAAGICPTPGPSMTPRPRSRGATAAAGPSGPIGSTSGSSHRPRSPGSTAVGPGRGAICPPPGLSRHPRPRTLPPGGPMYIRPGTPRNATPPPTSSGINESPEDTYVSTSTEDSMQELFRIPGVDVPIPKREQLAAHRAARSPDRRSSLPEDWDMEAHFNEMRQRVLARCNSPGGPGSPSSGGSSPPSFSGGNSGGGVGGGFGGGFGGDFGEGFGSGQEDWGNMGFGNEDFNVGIDAVLQEEARPEDHVDYPEDFPPPTDVFGPGFDWDAANLDQPSFPSSFPGNSLAGHSMSSEEGNFKLDTSFDTSALKDPVNPERLNALRLKLSNICTDQYRGIIEMLQEDASQHQLKYENLLKQARSEPFIDPNATLAPVGSLETSYPGSEYTAARHVSPPSSPGYRTPVGDMRIQGDISPNDLSSTASSQPSSGPMVPSWLTSSCKRDFDISPEYAEFDDPFSNVNNLMLLVKNQQDQYK